MSELKPGWKCSETWIAAGTQVLKILVLMGVLSGVREVEVEKLWAEAVIGVFAIIALAATARSLIASRTELKKLVVRNLKNE